MGKNLSPRQPSIAVYIAHSPPKKKKIMVVEKEVDGKTRFEGFDKGRIHLEKMERLLRFAKRNNLPVFWERMPEITDEPVMNALLQKTGFKRDEIVFCNGSPADLKHRAESKNINPKRFLMAGFYKEWCCDLAATAIASAFPEAELVRLEGDFNLSMFVNYHKRQITDRGRELAEEYTKYLKGSQARKGVRTAKLKRALLRL